MARHIHIHFADAGDFDEAKHKRAGNGQFGSGGGGAAKPAAKTITKTEGAAKPAAKKLGSK